MATLPEELVLTEILPKLPAKSLIQFKCVSKKWLDIITNDGGLKKAHRRHHTLRTSSEISLIVYAKKSMVDRVRCESDVQKLLLLSTRLQTDAIPPDVEESDSSYLLAKLKSMKLRKINHINLIGSSNGLVLLSKPLILTNPATRELRILPQPVIDYDQSYDCSPILDLGFDDESDDHKVLRVAETWKIEGGFFVWLLVFHVFSKRANSWRKLEPLSGFLLWSSKPHGVSIDGTFYFFALQEIPREKRTTSRKHNLVLLSFKYWNNEVQNIIDAPVFNSQGQGVELVRWKEDSLAMITLDQTVQNDVYDLWVLMRNGDDGNNGLRWSKLFVFDDRPDIRGVWSNQFLIIQKQSHQSSNLVLWDPQIKSDIDSCLGLLELLEPLWFFNVAIYVPTLVSVFPDR